MQAVNLIYVRNIISRTDKETFQDISFAVRVRNIGFGKRVTIHWCGEDHVWQSVLAEYLCETGDREELWTAKVLVPLTKEASLPGNIEFAASMDRQGEQYWDNRDGRNYSSEADSGVIVMEPGFVQVIGYDPVLQSGTVSLQVDVAVRQDLAPEKVTFHWSVDGWTTRHQAHGFFRRNYWDRNSHSNARNPNRYGWGIWSARIPVHHGYRLEYAVECSTRDGVFWDNRGGRNYRCQRSTLRAMALNLHTYQEKDQLRKFEQIAKVIQSLNVDLVCLQEVGENWNNGAGDWESNAARIINSHLPTPYHLHTDWSHLGFDRFREGVAILSRHPFVSTDSRYVSESQDPFSIHARKVVMAQVKVPYVGLVNVFSAHLSWPKDGFYPQFDHLRKWVADQRSDDTAATLVCGDFNIAAGSEAYQYILDTGEFEDQYLKIASSSVFQKVFRERQTDGMKLLENDGRIDYLWLTTGSRLRAIHAEELFTAARYGRVSDHTAYLVEFELR